MTESMKFGPEWLRNMSNDMNNISTSSSISNNNSSNNNSISSSANNSSIAPLGPRYHLAEYRYGREEMLSLFDKNLKSPEILPAFKKLYVEKVQSPLALIPTTEDEITTNSTRPWALRSPVGTIPVRGGGRGGIVDRGRGRSSRGVYHSSVVFQRPPPLYDEEIRSIQKERCWPERNGSNEIGSNDWNGSPSSSPRKEYTSHGRSNMENWRRNRVDDDSGDGWRSNSTVNSNAYRWSRSTSWRDEDIIVSNSNSGGSGGGVSGGDSNPNSTLNRSYSSTSSAIGGGISSHDRGGCGTGSSSSSSSSSSSNGGGGGGGGSNYKTSNSHNSQRNNELSLASSNKQGSSNSSQWDQDDMLPEWAMENPTDGGGSFDASGAFHAPNEDCEDSGNGKPPDINKESKLIAAIENEITKKTESVETETKENSVLNRRQDETKKVSKSTSLGDKKIKSEETAFTAEENNSQISVNSTTAKICKDTKNTTDFKKKNEIIKGTTSSSNIEKTVTMKMSSMIIDQQNNVSSSSGSVAATNVNKVILTPTVVATVSEISDRMKELSDDMVEKVIMDDELSTIGRKQPASANVPNSKNTAMLKASGNSVKNSSPTATSLLQQPSLVNNPLMPPPPPPPSQSQTSNLNDLWYYRDPQGKVQGPFTASEMVEWYRAGYFDENLFVRRVCDARYAALGELVKMCGNSMPFLSSHLIPPLSEIPTPVAPPPTQIHVTQNNQSTSPQATASMNVPKQSVNPLLGSNELISLDLQLQMLQKQFLLRQQSMILNKLAASEPWSLLNPEQQQALINQQMSQVVLPDHLMSLSALSNSLSIVNPSTYMLQQMIATAKNDMNSTTKSPTNQQLHSTLSSFAGSGGSSGTDFNNQSTIHNLMQNNVQSQPNLVPQSVSTHRNSASIDNDPIKSLLLQLQMQKSGMPAGGVTAAAVPPPTSGLPLSNKWSSNLNQCQTSWGTTNNGVSGNITATIPNVPASMWDFNPLPQAKPEMKTEQQIIEEQLQQQNEKLARHSTDLLKTLEDMNDLSNEINDHQKQQQQQQQQPQQQTQSQPQLQPHPQQQQQQQYQIQQQQLQQTSNKKNEKPKVISEEKSQKGQRIDEESSKRTTKNSNKADKKETKKIQSEEDKKKESAEDKKRQKEEKRRQQVEEEKRKQQEEEKRKLILEEKKRLEEIEQHRRAKMLENSSPIISKPIKPITYASSIAPWSNAGLPGITAPRPSFAEIQKAEMERRAEEQRLEQILEHQRKSQIMEMMMQKESSLKWNSQPLKSLNVKSLAEIQAEEHKRQQLANEQAANNTSVVEQTRRKDELNSGQSAGSNNSTFGSIWNNRPTQNIAWNSKSAWSTTSNAGFWEEPTKTASSVAVAVKQQQQQSNSRALSKSQTVSNMQTVNKGNTSNAVNNNSSGNSGGGSGSGNNLNVGSNNVSANNKQTKQGNKQQSINIGKVVNSQNSKTNTSSLNNSSKKDDARNEFISWCIKALSTMNSSVDVPTFIGFLQDIESPYEVKDYIRMYLGESKECSEFAKQFLERRSKYKNQQRAQNAHIDDMCSPAPAINPSSNDFQEVKGKNKKIKKNKMTKLDTRILGFSVTAAQDRLNVGDRDYGDAS